MALTFVGKGSSGRSDAVDVTLTLPAGIAQNDYVLVGAFDRSGADRDMAMTTSGYSELADLYANDSADTNLGAFRKIMGPTPDSTAVITNTGAVHHSGVFHCWRGVDTTTPEDATTTTLTATDGANLDPPAIVTVTDNAVVVGCGACTEGDTITVGSGFENFEQEIDSSPNGFRNIYMESQFKTPAGTSDPPLHAISGATGDSRAMFTVAIRPAAGGGGSILLQMLQHTHCLGGAYA